MVEKLNERKILVLSVIVDNYIKNKQPAGSRILTKRYNLDFSPATMRNVMLDLEELGYLTHAHASGGKIPTPKGIKFYLNMILSNFNPKLKEEFERLPLNNAFLTLDEKMNRILDTVADMSELVSMITLPDFTKTRIKNLQFIKIGEGKVLCVLVSDTNLMDTRVVSMKKDLADAELKDFSEYITNEYRGYTLEEVKDSIEDFMAKQKGDCDALLNKLLTEAQSPRVLVDGIKNVFNYPEFEKDLEKLKKLIATLEDKKKLLELIKNAMNSERLILVGDELPLDELKELGFVSSSYKYRGVNVGVVGVVGPINMDYEEMLNIIESAKRKIDEIINA
ncbi:heat-inducible transcriptional repressor HrcA [Hippea jasoniae]|uniref:heat-inducible transcriptional repressor HrcA n=1 Tax=Hippea jasoniae TaxID=944479 RepID=UPI00055900D6|nr:heat-inducible transcriptional repressor HrcA [Hippea jasoniae]